MASGKVIVEAAKLLATKGGRDAAKKFVMETVPNATAALRDKIISAAAEASRISNKTGAPISDLVRAGTSSQTITKKVAQYAGGAGFAGGAIGGNVDRLVGLIDDVTKSDADTKPASSTRRKSPKGGQTIQENRRVVSETKLARGGMPMKANCGASVKPNRKART